MGSMRIGILLFEGVDLLDVGGPYEVFLTASRLAVRAGNDAPFEVVTIAATGHSVTSYGGMGLVASSDVATAGALDVLVVPGTIDLDARLADAAFLADVGALAAHAELVTSVCTGAFFLGEVGLLKGQPWTTHWEDIDLLASRIGTTGATRGARWVDAGSVVTSGGLSCGLDMALHLVERLAGRALAEATARQIDYHWRE